MASLFFYYSTMNAGKTAGLIQSAYNYKERGMRPLILKPKTDTRDGVSNIIRSRTGNMAECTLVGLDENIYFLVKGFETPPSVVLIDEVQFLTKEQIRQLALIVDDLNIAVMAYGLRSDFQGNLFPASSALFALANKISEVRTICWCGKLATMVLRLNQDGKVVREGNQIEVGGNDKYISVCRKHFFSGEHFC